MAQVHTLEEAREHLPEMLQRVAASHTPAVVRLDQGALLVLAADLDEATVATIELLVDRDARQRVRESEQAYARGDVLTEDEIRAEHGLPSRG